MEYNEQFRLLRELAKQVREIAHTSANDAKRQKWADHNDLKGGTEPLLWVCPDEDGGWVELIPEERIVCTDPRLRPLERQLRKYIYHAQHFDDDFVFEPLVRFDLPGTYTGYTYAKADQTSAWGIPIKGHGVSKEAYHLDNYLSDQRNVETLLNHEVDFIVDEQEYRIQRDLYETVLDGLLRVDIVMPYVPLVQSLLIELVHLHGLEELLIDLYDKPEQVKAIVRHMAVSKKALLERLEAGNLLFDNNTNIYTGSGGLGYSNVKVADPQHVRLSEMWGFADSQEFSSVSPQMFKEFALEYQKIGLSLFGKGCYGCCEPLDDRFEMVFEALPNIRRLSVSPWSNVEVAAKKIGNKAIFSWKPNPAIICCGFDEKEMESQLRHVREVTKGCTTEIILKDIRTCDNTPAHLQKFANLVNRIFK